MNDGNEIVFIPHKTESMDEILNVERTVDISLSAAGSGCRVPPCFTSRQPLPGPAVATRRVVIDLYQMMNGRARQFSHKLDLATQTVISGE